MLASTITQPNSNAIIDSGGSMPFGRFAATWTFHGLAFVWFCSILCSPCLEFIPLSKNPYLESNSLILTFFFDMFFWGSMLLQALLSNGANGDLEVSLRLFSLLSNLVFRMASLTYVKTYLQDAWHCRYLFSCFLFFFIISKDWEHVSSLAGSAPSFHSLHQWLIACYIFPPSVSYLSLVSSSYCIMLSQLAW